MNARLARVVDSTPGLVGALLLGLLLAPFERPLTWTRATTIAALGITAAVVLVWTWPR